MQFTVVYTGYGTVVYSGTYFEGQMVGNYNKDNGAETGTFLINRTATSSRNATGSWSGTYSPILGATNVVTASLSQTGNVLSGSVNFGGTSASIAGEVFGANVQIRGDFGSLGNIRLDGQLSGTGDNTMSGPWAQTSGGSASGFFQMVRGS
jgi:hypothetical protein